MSNQIKELALPALLVVLLMVYPAVILAEPINPTPITAVYSAGEWVIDKMTAKPKPSVLTPEQRARFDSWLKEDWIRDDAYACMWERNWIRKYNKDVCL
jgi:hypothetical protein